MRRTQISFVLLSAVLILAGCNGTVSSVSFPVAAPWNEMGTDILSPTDDLVAVSSGAGITAELTEGPFIGSTRALVACNNGFVTYTQSCFEWECDPQERCAPNTAVGKRFIYSLRVHLDRDVFASGGVEVQNGTGATQMGLSVNAGSPGGSLDVAAGYSEGFIPGVDFNNLEERGALVLAPHWSDFDSGSIAGQICPNGVCSPQTVAICSTDGAVDVLDYATIAQPGTYSGTCGSVPINLTINPPYSSVGQCISGQKAARCGGLKGQAKAACNHAQIGVCHATFNVPSSHNP